jgi:hypothetical protein
MVATNFARGISLPEHLCVGLLGLAATASAQGPCGAGPPCNPDQWCSGESCSAIGDAGDPCVTTISKTCGPGLLCISGQASATCQAKSNVGETCGAGTAGCVDTTFCDDKNGAVRHVFHEAPL